MNDSAILRLILREEKIEFFQKIGSEKTTKFLEIDYDN
jgi:hypothetical protein